MSNSRLTPARHNGDYYFSCMICGDRCWASTARKLSTYTGRGGLIVCPECDDPIDYGLVPYTIPAEKPVPFAFDNTQAGAPYSAIPTKYGTFDADIYDPFNGFNDPDQQEEG